METGTALALIGMGLSIIIPGVIAWQRQQVKMAESTQRIESLEDKVEKNGSKLEGLASVEVKLGHLTESINNLSKGLKGTLEDHEERLRTQEKKA